MAKVKNAFGDRQQAIKKILVQFNVHSRSPSSNPEEMASSIVERAFKTIEDGAFRFPENIKVKPKTKVSN
jgi:hypothetical protein